MKIIITMAGEGSRFRKQGFDMPKYMIMARGKSLFEWSISSLKNFFNNEFIFITRDTHKSVRFIQDSCDLLDIKNAKIIELDHLTAGQAATVLRARVLFGNEEPILIYNIDTYVEPDALKPSDIQGDGWVPSFIAEGSHWSFVKVDNPNAKSGRVIEIAEKVRISNLATIGLYYFSSMGLFEESYRTHVFNNEKEHYIAPIYSEILNTDAGVYTTIIDESKIHALGTPEEVEAFDPDFINKQ
ncbi:glycosyltransferase family 2 protein [Candidatus Woesearchaeota archaeon]|nr:glycosyltransferase family 2 protein [Candidatus Woesearchaeota archaeon]